MAEKRLPDFLDRFTGEAGVGGLRTLLVLNSREMKGMTAVNPINGAEMPLIEKELLVLPPRGTTGLQTVNPAHNIEDLKLAEKYHLSKRGLINPYTGRLNDSTRQLEGLLPDDPKVLSFLRSH